MTQQDRAVLEKLTDRIGAVEGGVKELTVAICGNGTKGLSVRMNETEGWQDKHAEAHRLFLEDQHAYRIEREKKEAKKERAKNIRAYSFMGTAGLTLLGFILKSLLGSG